jgi:hypothetical protein
MDPLHDTIEEFAADGYTHIQCYCQRCRAIRLRPINYLPRISMGLTRPAFSKAALFRVRWAGLLRKPWRVDDVIGKPAGRRA